MKRKKSTAQSIRWQYDCRAPIEGREAVATQMSLAHRYNNNLVELELKRRKKFAEAEQELFPDLAPLITQDANACKNLLRLASEVPIEKGETS